MLDIRESVLFDKEDWLNTLLESVMDTYGLTIDEFARDWIVEEHPLEIQSVSGHLTNDYTFTVRQQFKVRLKTEEEKQLAIENKEKIDVDPNNA